MRQIPKKDTASILLENLQFAMRFRTPTDPILLMKYNIDQDKIDVNKIDYINLLSSALRSLHYRTFYIPNLLIDKYGIENIWELIDAEIIQKITSVVTLNLDYEPLFEDFQNGELTEMPIYIPIPEHSNIGDAIDPIFIIESSFESIIGCDMKTLIINGKTRKKLELPNNYSQKKEQIKAIIDEVIYINDSTKIILPSCYVPRNIKNLIPYMPKLKEVAAAIIEYNAMLYKIVDEYNNDNIQYVENEYLTKYDHIFDSTPNLTPYGQFIYISNIIDSLRNSNRQYVLSKPIMGTVVELFPKQEE